MKPVIAFIILIIAGSSCKKADQLLYESPESICFNFPELQKDSIIYTFAYTPDKGSDTIWLPVRIAGVRKPVDRKFVIAVRKDSTTAQEGLHYQALKPFYIMPADSGRIKVPLVIYNKDASLIEKSVTIRFILQRSDEFAVEFPDLIKGKLVFSSTLELPAWWASGKWISPQTYSRTKHQLFIIVTGVTELTLDGMDAPKNLYLVSLLTSLLNDPFTWVTRNPAKGYVIEKIAGTNDYYFFSKSNPDRKILYKKDAIGAAYHFIDENGTIITN